MVQNFYFDNMLHIEPFKSISRNADQLQDLVDIYGLTRKEQDRLPNAGKNCFH